MSIIYCEQHGGGWDSDWLENCPRCEQDRQESLDAFIAEHGHNPYECEYEHCPTCRQHWRDEKADVMTRKED